MSEFAHPWLLALAGIAPVLLGWLTVTRWRHQRVTALAVRHATGLRLLSALPPALALVGVATAWVASAGPRRASFRTRPTSGRNLVVLLDASASMATASGGFATAQRAVERFVELRPYDRLALVMFGSRAAVLAPLTHDHATLLDTARRLTPEALGMETAIGDGLAVALGLLEGAPPGSAGIVLVSDGRNNAGVLDPRTTAEAAADRGVIVDTVGVAGAAEGSSEAGLDESLLHDLASRTGGEFVRAGTGENLSGAFERLSRLRPAPAPATPDLVWQDRSGPLAGAAAMLLLGAALAEFASRRGWA
jgi:Ca-activated chloride channel family protein